MIDSVILEGGDIIVDFVILLEGDIPFDSINFVESVISVFRVITLFISFSIESVFNSTLFFILKKFVKLNLYNIKKSGFEIHLEEEIIIYSLSCEE